MASASTSSDSKQLARRRASNDTACSSNSSCFLHKRKQTHPLAAPVRTHQPRTANNAVKQRVFSARLLKLRSLQNQLNDANFHLAELQQENRALKNLQTRQDRALSKYEGANADLPRLLKSHEEEIRVLTSKNKALKKTLKDVSDLLKIREEELASAREQLKTLTALSKQRNLGERHALSEQVEDLKEKVKSSDDKINMLNRKLQLETKNYKYKLNAEVSKTKQLRKELLQALSEIDRISSVTGEKGKLLLSNNHKRFANVNNRQSISLINLDDKPSKEPSKVRNLSADEPKVTFNFSNRTSSSSTKGDDGNESDQSELKLEPITNEKDAKTEISGTFMTSPTESIKARLSTSSISTDEIEQLNKTLEKTVLIEKEPIFTEPTFAMLRRQNSSQKLEKLSKSSSATETSSQKNDHDVAQRLGSLCTDFVATAKDCGSVVDSHRLNYETAKSETEKLLESLRETDSMNSRLRHASFLAAETFEIPDKDLDTANQIWNEEYQFRKSMQPVKETSRDYESFFKSDRNGNVIKKATEVAPADKSKLLATLRAIDNGEEIEEVSYGQSVSQSKNKLVEDLFGGLPK